MLLLPFVKQFLRHRPEKEGASYVRRPSRLRVCFHMQMHQKTRRLGLFSNFLETSFSSVFIEGRDSS